MLPNPTNTSGATDTGFSVPVPQPPYSGRGAPPKPTGTFEGAMVPAYVAKAMERQKAKLDKEHALVPAPTANFAPQAGATSVASVAPTPTAKVAAPTYATTAEWNAARGQSGPAAYAAAVAAGQTPAQANSAALAATAAFEAANPKPGTAPATTAPANTTEAPVAPTAPQPTVAAPTPPPVTVDPFAGLTPNTAEWSKVYQSEFARLQAANPTWNSSQIAAELNRVTGTGATPAPVPTPTTEPTPTPAPTPTPTSEPVVTPPAAVVPPVSNITPPAATDTPVVVAAKTQAQKTFDDMVAKAQEWMNAKEDPASKLAFSRAIVQSALTNQEAMNAAKASVANNPALAGQPAGDALLALRAQQLGLQMSDLKANLAISEAKAISELNKYGFEATYKLNELRKTEDEKNLTSYGSVLDEMIKGGADNATLENFFNTNIKPLLPGGGAGMTLDMFRNEGTRAQLLQAHRSETQKLFRDAILQHADLATIRQLMSAAYTDDQIASIGKDWMDGKSLDEVNAVLKDAGYDQIEDLSDLIGNEDMIGEAKIIADAKKEAAKKPYDDDVDNTLQTLRDAGYELTPATEAAARAYIIRQSLPGADVNELPPWRDEATAHLYESWPLPGTNRWGDPIEDTPTTHEVYARNQVLNTAWERYVSQNPTSATRLTRAEWYDAAMKHFEEGDTAPAAWLEQGISNWTPPVKKVEAGDRTLAAAEGKRLVDAAKAFSDINWNDVNVVEYVNSLARLADKDVTKALADAGAPTVVNINGNVYRVQDLDNRGGGEGGDYIRLEDKTGKTVWIKTGTGTPLAVLPAASQADKPSTNMHTR